MAFVELIRERAHISRSRILRGITNERADEIETPKEVARDSIDVEQETRIIDENIEVCERIEHYNRTVTEVVREKTGKKLPKKDGLVTRHLDKRGTLKLSVSVDGEWFLIQFRNYGETIRKHTDPES